MLFVSRITTLLTAGFVIAWVQAGPARAQLSPPLEVTATRPLLDEHGNPLPGANPSAALFGRDPAPGCAIQVLSPGADGAPAPPSADGQAGGDDAVLYQTRIGVGMPPNTERSGRFSTSFHPPPAPGTRLFVRAFNRPDPAQATHWGDSEVVVFTPLKVVDVSAHGLTATSRPMRQASATEK